MNGGTLRTEQRSRLTERLHEAADTAAPVPPFQPAGITVRHDQTVFLQPQQAVGLAADLGKDVGMAVGSQPLGVDGVDAVAHSVGGDIGRRSAVTGKDRRLPRVARHGEDALLAGDQRKVDALGAGGIEDGIGIAVAFQRGADGAAGLRQQRQRHAAEQPAADSGVIFK